MVLPEAVVEVGDLDPEELEYIGLFRLPKSRAADLQAIPFDANGEEIDSLHFAHDLRREIAVRADVNPQIRWERSLLPPTTVRLNVDSLNTHDIV
jgi:hypothetical protein